MNAQNAIDWIRRPENGLQSRPPDPRDHGGLIAPSTGRRRTDGTVVTGWGWGGGVVGAAVAGAAAAAGAVVVVHFGSFGRFVAHDSGTTGLKVIMLQSNLDFIDLDFNDNLGFIVCPLQPTVYKRSRFYW